MLVRITTMAEPMIPAAKSPSRTQIAIFAMVDTVGLPPQELIQKQSSLTLHKGFVKISLTKKSRVHDSAQVLNISGLVERAVPFMRPVT
jgi:hypothetical protein